jgi:hypothetical protein
MREIRTSGSTRGEQGAMTGMRLLRHVREILKQSYVVAETMFPAPLLYRNAFCDVAISYPG